MSLPIALQMYTVRDVAKNDFAGTLKQVADIGFKYIEFAGFGGGDAAGAKAACDKVGLTGISAHVGIDALRDNVEGAINDAKTAGYKHIVCPFMPKPMQDSIDGYREAASILNEAGLHCRNAGISLGYHNHDFEFRTMDGSTGFETLLNHTDSELVSFELDIMWVNFAGQSVIDWMKKLKGRLPLLHVKDHVAGGERKFTEVGTGVVPIADAVKIAADCGVKYLIIEQDNHWNPDPMTSVRTSYNNLKKITG